MTSSVNGCAKSPMNSHSPPARISSIWRSANRHMKSSFSFRRLGVINRMSNARCAVCFGGSNDGNWSLNGNSSRCASMTRLMSSPSTGTENFTNGPLTVLHDEKVAGSWYTEMASS